MGNNQSNFSIAQNLLLQVIASPQTLSLEQLLIMESIFINSGETVCYLAQKSDLYNFLQQKLQNKSTKRSQIDSLIKEFLPPSLLRPQIFKLIFQDLFVDNNNQSYTLKNQAQILFPKPNMQLKPTAGQQQILMDLFRCLNEFIFKKKKTSATITILFIGNLLLANQWVIPFIIQNVNVNQSHAINNMKNISLIDQLILAGEETNYFNKWVIYALTKNKMYTYPIVERMLQILSQSEISSPYFLTLIDQIYYLSIKQALNEQACNNLQFLMEQILQKITKESEIEILTYSNFFKVFQRIAYKNRDFKLATKFQSDQEQNYFYSKHFFEIMNKPNAPYQVLKINPKSIESVNFQYDEQIEQQQQQQINQFQKNQKQDLIYEEKQMIGDFLQILQDYKFKFQHNFLEKTNPNSDINFYASMGAQQQVKYDRKLKMYLQVQGMQLKVLKLIHSYNSDTTAGEMVVSAINLSKIGETMIANNNNNNNQQQQQLQQNSNMYQQSIIVKQQEKKEKEKKKQEEEEKENNPLNQLVNLLNMLGEVLNEAQQGQAKDERAEQTLVSVDQQKQAVFEQRQVNRLELVYNNITDYIPIRKENQNNQMLQQQQQQQLNKLKPFYPQIGIDQNIFNQMNDNEKRQLLFSNENEFIECLAPTIQNQVQEYLDHYKFKIENVAKQLSEAELLIEKMKQEGHKPNNINSMIFDQNKKDFSAAFNDITTIQEQTLISLLLMLMGSSSLNKNNYDSILELLDFLCLNPKNTVKYLDLLIVILNVLELECEKIPQIMQHPLWLQEEPKAKKDKAFSISEFFRKQLIRLIFIKKHAMPVLFLLNDYEKFEEKNAQVMKMIQQQKSILFNGGISKFNQAKYKKSINIISFFKGEIQSKIIFLLLEHCNLAILPEEAKFDYQANTQTTFFFQSPNVQLKGINDFLTEMILVKLLLRQNSDMSTEFVNFQKIMVYYSFRNPMSFIQFSFEVLRFFVGEFLSLSQIQGQGELQEKKGLGIITKVVLEHVDYVKKLKESIFQSLQVQTLDGEMTEQQIFLLKTLFVMFQIEKHDEIIEFFSVFFYKIIYIIEQCYQNIYQLKAKERKATKQEIKKEINATYYQGKDIQKTMKFFWKICFQLFQQMLEITNKSPVLNIHFLLKSFYILYEMFETDLIFEVENNEEMKLQNVDSSNLHSAHSKIFQQSNQNNNNNSSQEQNQEGSSQQQFCITGEAISDTSTIFSMAQLKSYADEKFKSFSEYYLEKYRDVRFIQAQIRLKHSKIETLRKKLTLEEKQTYMQLNTISQINDRLQEKAKELQKRLKVQVSRKNYWQSTMASLSQYYPEELILSKVMINYENEDAVDAGGVSRDWYNKVPLDIFDTKNYFWTYTECGMMPAIESIFIPNYLLHFEYMGRFVALAFFDKQNIGFSFTPCLIKQILGQQISYEDFQASFPDYYRDLKGLLDMKENDGVEDLMKCFQIEYRFQFANKGQDAFYFDLKENGANIPVTYQNRKEYIKLFSQWLMIDSVSKQIEAFVKGFYSIIPKSALTMFTVEDFNLILEGISKIDVDEMKKFASYDDGYNAQSQQIVWFWEIINEFSDEMKARFLNYCFSKTKVVAGGFQNMQLNIKKVDDANRFPIVHTCGKEGQRGLKYSQIELPSYQTKETMKQKLEQAIEYNQDQGGQMIIV